MNKWYLAVEGRYESPNNNQHLFGHDSKVIDDRKGSILEKHAKDDDSGSPCKNNEQRHMVDMNEFQKAVADDVAEQLHSDKSGCDAQETTEVAEQLHSDKTGSGIEETSCCSNSEDNDLFKKHFGSLSSITKVSISCMVLFDGQHLIILCTLLSLRVMFVSCNLRNINLKY